MTILRIGPDDDARSRSPIVRTTDSRIDAGDIAPVLNVRSPPPAAADAPGDAPRSIRKATRDIEQELVRKALGQSQGNRTNAAKLLEISPRALLYKRKESGIS